MIAIYAAKVNTTAVKKDLAEKIQKTGKKRGGVGLAHHGTRPICGGGRRSTGSRPRRGITRSRGGSWAWRWLLGRAGWPAHWRWRCSPPIQIGSRSAAGARWLSGQRAAARRRGRGGRSGRARGGGRLGEVWRRWSARRLLERSGGTELGPWRLGRAPLAGHGREVASVLQRRGGRREGEKEEGAADARLTGVAADAGGDRSWRRGGGEALGCEGGAQMGSGGPGGVGAGPRDLDPLCWLVGGLGAFWPLDRSIRRSDSLGSRVSWMEGLGGNFEAILQGVAAILC